MKPNPASLLKRRELLDRDGDVAGAVADYGNAGEGLLDEGHRLRGRHSRLGWRPHLALLQQLLDGQQLLKLGAPLVVVLQEDLGFEEFFQQHSVIESDQNAKGGGRRGEGCHLAALVAARYLTCLTKRVISRSEELE